MGLDGAWSLEEETPRRQASQLPIQASSLLHSVHLRTSSTDSKPKACPYVTWSHSLVLTPLDKPTVSLSGTVSTMKATSTSLSPYLDVRTVLLPLALATTRKPLSTSALPQDLTIAIIISFSIKRDSWRQTRSFSTAVPRTHWSERTAAVWTPSTVTSWGLWLRWEISSPLLDPMVRSAETVAGPIKFRAIKDHQAE